MGTLFTIRVWVPHDVEPENHSLERCTAACREAFDRVAELNGVFSDYLIDSELSRLSRAPADTEVLVSEALLDILLQAEELHRRSGGAFDVTVGPMVRLWRRARKNGELPRREQIDAARARTGMEHLAIDPNRRTVRKGVDGMSLDLGGIAKGYAADEMLRLLEERGFPHAVVAASGDIVAGKSPPGTAGWTVGVETLEMEKTEGRALPLANAAISTSGDTRKFLVIDGVRYSHIVDRKTGLGLTRRIAATVLAPNATLSDGYATALCVMGPEEGLRLIEENPQLECRIVVAGAEGKARVYFSSGFPAP